MSDQLKTVCGDCGKRLSMPDMPGQKVACPGCKGVLLIPTREAVEAALPVRLAVTPTKKGPGRSVIASQATEDVPLFRAEPTAETAIQPEPTTASLFEAEPATTPVFEAEPVSDIAPEPTSPAAPEPAPEPAPAPAPASAPASEPADDAGAPITAHKTDARSPLHFLWKDFAGPDGKTVVPEITDDGAIGSLACTLIVSHPDLELVAIDRQDIAGQRYPNLKWAAVWKPSGCVVVLSETHRRDQVDRRADVRHSWEAEWPGPLQDVVAIARAAASGERKSPVPQPVANLLRDFWSTYTEAQTEQRRIEAAAAERKKNKGAGRVSAQEKLKEGRNQRRFTRCDTLHEQIQKYFRFEELPG